MILGIGLNDGAFIIFDNITVEECGVDIDVLVYDIIILGGILVHVPILVPVHILFDISNIVGIVIVIVPFGDLAGNI